MNRNSGFALNTSRMRVVVGIVVEVLMHAAVLDEHEVARLPVEALAVVDVVAAPLEHVEHGAVHMSVLLAVGAGRVDLDMRLDRLGDAAASGLMTCLPKTAGHPSTARFLMNRRAVARAALGEVAVGAFSARTKVRFFVQRSQISSSSWVWSGG